MKKMIQITSGRGPAECCWVVAQVLKIIMNEARNNGLILTVMEKVNGPVNRTISSVAIQINGDDKKVSEFLKNWSGTIQWNGKSQFRKYHKRKSWFIGINVLSMNKDEIVISDKQINYEATRAGGPGGQHVNKVSTAIRATHIPTGLSVVASDSRSQMQNKKKAKERLNRLIENKQLDQQVQKIKSDWQNHNELERGNPIRVFHGHDFKSEYLTNNYKAKRKAGKQELKKINFKE